MDAPNKEQTILFNLMQIKLNAWPKYDCLNIVTGLPWLTVSTVYTRVQVERVYKSNPIFEAKNTTFLEKVWFFSFHQLNKINKWSGIQG